MKRTTKRLLAILLCFAVLPVNHWAVRAQATSSAPPQYLRELSRLVAATASENDFGVIQLTVGESEMDIDGQTQPICGQEAVAPYVDANGEVQIPVEVIEEADAAGSYISEEALQAQGYAVSFDADTGVIRITEPYGLCRLIVQTANGKVKDTYGAVQKVAVSDNRTVLQYADKETTAAAATLLRADASVLSCAADRIVTVSASSEDVSPSDFLIGASEDAFCWGTRRTGADAWMAAHADDDLAEVVVALIDTGVEATHPFLQGRVLSGGWDFVNDDADPADDNSHGTHCAGILCDASPANVRILPIKVLSDEGSGSMEVALEAMRWAVDQGADILSMSFGATWSDEELADTESVLAELQQTEDAIRYAYDAGVTCVAAAGNESESLDEKPHIPGGLPHVITVGSIGEQDYPSSFTNYGSMITICAPGENIVSSVPGGQYAQSSGTSMACPLAAAVCADFLSLDKTQTPDDLLECLTAHAEDVGAPGRDDYCGAGCVSLRAFTPVSGMTLPYETLRLTTGTSIALKAVYTPAAASTRTAAFTSSDPAVASVDDFGNIFAKHSGDAVITAVSTDGGFTAACAIHVSGSSGIREITAGGYNTFALRTDGTVQYAGIYRQQVLGNISVDVNRWNTMRDAARMPISGITKFWPMLRLTYQRSEDSSSETIYGDTVFNYYYTKEDGLLYYLSYNSESSDDAVVQMKADGRPLTGIRDVQYQSYISADPNAPIYEYVNGQLTRVFPSVTGAVAIDETGTVYTEAAKSEWAPVRKRDGSVLQGVRRISGAAAFCEDGSVWYLAAGIDTRRYNSETRTVAIPYATAADGYIDGFMMSIAGVEYPRTAVLLKSDGTVWGFGENWFNFFGNDPDYRGQLVYEDGQPLTGIRALYCTGYGFFALREDDTVISWGAGGDISDADGYLGVGEPVTERSFPRQVVLKDGSPLTGVREFLPAHGGVMLFLREDNSVWGTGLWKPVTSRTGMQTYYASPLTVGEPVSLLDIPAEPFEPPVPARSVLMNTDRLYIGVGESVRLRAALLPANADLPYVTYCVSNYYSPYGTVSSSGVVTGTAEGTFTVRACAFEAQRDVYAECTVTVGSVRAQSVSVSTAPKKDVYDRGEALDTTAGELCVRFSDGTTRNYPIYAQFCSGFDAYTPGKQTVTVEYGGLTASFNVIVRQAPVSIEVTAPKKTEYLPGETLDLTGGKLRVNYPDGWRIIPLTAEMCSCLNSEDKGIQKITVTYTGQKDSFCVRVVSQYGQQFSPGDANADGDLNLQDIVRIERFLAGGWDAVIDLDIADVNHDGEVNLRDIVLLRRYLAGGWNIVLQ